MSGIYENDPVAVQGYSAQLTADADVWDEIAALARDGAEVLTSDAAAWKKEWEPKAPFDTAVSAFKEQLETLARHATEASADTRRRATAANDAAQRGAETDEENGAEIGRVEVKVTST